MINNTSLQRWDRLAAKRLDRQFAHRIVTGLSCSPFEADAVVQAVHEVYGFFFHCAPTPAPGQLQLQVVSVEVPAGPRLLNSRQLLVVLTLEDPAEDLVVRQKGGVVGLRRHRLVRVCNEALQQGGLLTLEDLAYRLFNCGQRTLCRDLQALRRQHVTVPLRSTVKDIGRTLSHRRLIVEQWLAGKEYSQIAHATCHGIPAVRNYVEKFKRVSVLAHEGFDAPTIAFLARLSRPLTQQYLQLLRRQKALKHRQAELRSAPKKSLATLPSNRK